jgi:hypothetical protein
MLKSIALSLVAVLFGATSAAQAACNGSCCTQAEPSCMAAAPAHEHSNMNMPTTRAPQGTRSFSYEPSTRYAPARGTSRPGWNSGIRGASAKALGNY